MLSSDKVRRNGPSCSQGVRRPPRRCRSSENRQPFAAAATIAEAVAVAETSRSARPWACDDTARRVGRLLEGQSAALDGELQEYERLDDGLHRLRGELYEVRATIAKDFEEVRRHIQELAADFQSRLEVKFSQSSSLEPVQQLHDSQDAATQASHDQLGADKLRASRQDDVKQCFDKLEECRCHVDRVQSIFHQELLFCRRDVDNLKGSVQELCSGVDRVTELRGYLECHASECFGQIGALWTALGRSSGPTMAVSLPADVARPPEPMLLSHNVQPVQKAPSSRQGVVSRSTPCSSTPAVIRSVSSPERTGTPLSWEGGLPQSVASATSRSACLLPPRPADTPGPVPAQSVHLRGRCSDVDACAL